MVQLLRRLSVLVLIFSVVARADYPAGTADQVLVVPHAGGRAKMGQVDLSQTAATKNQLLQSRGGTGVDSSSSTGIPHLSTGNWTFSSVNLNSSDVSNNLPVTNLDSGTNADAAHFWNGTGHWVIPPSAILYAPVVNRFTSGSGTYNLAYAFTVSSASATAGATYSNNSCTFTVYSTISSATTLYTNGTCAPTSTGTLTKTGGTGDSTITFTSESAALYIVVEILGGGGGGGGGNSGGTGPTGTAGGNTTFGSAQMGGGSGGQGGGGSSNFGGAGGGVTATIGVVEAAVAGGVGTSGNQDPGAVADYPASGPGGNSAFGGAGGGLCEGCTGGVNAAANSGSGGAGAAFAFANVSAGGGAGAYAKMMVTSPSATYSYSVGGGGAGGSSTNNGGNGGNGFVMVEAHFQ